MLNYKITEPITLTINNCYDITQWEQELIIRCVNDHPTFTIREIAKLLGLTERTLYRKLLELNKKLGYTIRKNLK